MRKYFASALALALTCAAFSGAAFAGPGGGGKSDEDPGKSANAPGQEKKAESTPAAQTAAPGQQKKAAATTSASTKGKSANAPGQQKKAAVQTQNENANRGGGSFKATSSGSAGHRHTICHATGSESNPFVRITPSVSGVFNGHMGHQRGEDIIPPFVYKGTTYSQNWDATGQAIFAAGCEVPAQPLTTAAAAPTAQVLGVQAQIRRQAAEKPAKAKAQGGVLGAAAELRAVGERELPFTGIPLWIAALVALVLLSTGIGLRRATR